MTHPSPNLAALGGEQRIDLPPVDDDGDLHELALAARRQAWVIAICTVLGLCLGAAHYVTSPREYYGGATLMIEERLSDLGQELSTSLPLARNDTGFQNEIQILRSQHLAVEVVRALRLHENDAFLSPPSSVLGQAKDATIAFVKAMILPATEPLPTPPMSPEEREELRIVETATLLGMQTDFTRLGRSSSVEIGFTSHDPGLAAAIPNAYAAAYLEDGVQANVEASERMAGWMRVRIEELRQSALDAAREAEQFRLDMGATDQQGLRERVQRAEALNELFLAMQSRYQQIALEGSFPVSNGRILTQAIPPKRPAKPKAWQLFAAGLMLGMMAGLAAAVVREYRETGFRTGRDVEAVARVAFLGYLPTVRRRDLRRRFSRRSAAVQAISDRFVSIRRSIQKEGPDGRAALANPYAPKCPKKLPRDLCVSGTAPGTVADKALRNILATVDLDFDARSGRVVAVGAVIEGEGATTVAANLANLAALSGRRTLLIDGDFDRSALSRRFGIAGSDGALAVLNGSIGLGRAIYRLPQSGLDLLPTGAGRASPHVAGPSCLPGLAELVATARDSYDDIFIDLPSLGLGPEAKTLVRSIDRIVLVTRWGLTPRRTVRLFLDHEREIRRRVVGAVLNRANLRQLPRYGVHLWRNTVFPTTRSG